MNGGYLHATFEQLSHDRIDLRFEQHQITHHHRPGGRRHEGYPSTKRERRLNPDPVDGHLQIRSWELAMHSAGYSRSPPSVESTLFHSISCAPGAPMKTNAKTNAKAT